MSGGGTDGEARLYALLDEWKIEYIKHEHPAYFTVAEADAMDYVLPGLNLKNLFLKDKQSGERFLVILDGHRRLDFKALAPLTGWRKPTFCSAAELWESLGLTPGSVSPFGLINDRRRTVTVVLGKCLGDAGEEELVNFHPNTNTATLGLTKKDFLRFLQYMGNRVLLEP